MDKRQLAIVLAIAALPFAASLSPCFGAGLQASAWPMFQRDAEHAARSQASISISPSILWSVALSDSAEFSSPAIDIDGNIYIGDVGDRLNKFSSNGTFLWNYDTGGNVRRSSPAIAEDGTVYIGASDGSFHAVNPDGSNRWTFLAGGGVKTAPAVDANGAIYFGADDGVLYSLDELGALRWTYQAPDSIRSSPAIATDSLVVFGSHDGSVTAIRTDGTFRWSGTTGGAVKAGVSIGQGDDIFIPSQDGFIYALRNHGAFNWAVFTDHTLRGTPAIGVTGHVYLTVANEVWCLDDDGTQCWIAATSAALLASPVVHTDPVTFVETVIVGSEDGFLYGISDGVIVWSVEIGAPIRSSAAISAEGVIYVGANDGRLYAIGESTPANAVLANAASQIRVTPNPARPGVSIDFRSSQEADGELVILDPQGRQLETVSVHDGLATWAGTASERPLAAGVYFYEWRVVNDAQNGRFVLLR